MKRNRELQIALVLYLSMILAACQKEPDTVAVTGITLSQTTVELTEGESTRITATVSPSNATNKKVLWSSDNPLVTVTDGTITGTKPCNATVTAKSDDGGKTATCTVTVKAKVISVTGVSLNTTSLTMTEGDTQTLTSTVSPSNATDKSVTWSSSNTSVATVSSSGVVTAKSPGTATITVRTNDGGKTATCAVTVKAKVISVTGVSLNKTNLMMTEGDSQTLTATVTPSNATDKSVTWSSNNTSIATVSSSVLGCRHCKESRHGYNYREDERWRQDRHMYSYRQGEGDIGYRSKFEYYQPDYDRGRYPDANGDSQSCKRNRQVSYLVIK